MATGVTIYKNSDGSAPVLSGTVGSLLGVLDGCLVTGYGIKPAAGWTKPFTGAAKTVYRPPLGNNFHLRVNDSATVQGPDEAAGAPNAREARIRGYESMTSVDIGTGPFPNATAQSTTGLTWRKSATLDATPRPWIVVADNRSVMIFVLSGDVASGYMAGGFGDFFSLKGVTDSYRTFIVGRTAEAGALATFGSESFQLVNGNALTTPGHFIPRQTVLMSGVPTPVGGSIAIGKHGDSVKGVPTGTPMAGTVPFPNPPDAGIYISPLWVHDIVGTQYGRLRGFWEFLHPIAAVADADVFHGTGSLAGKDFLLIKGSGAIGGAALTGIYLVETSDTWETN